MAKGSPQKKPGPASIQNRRARHDYDILETLEAGIALVGSEVKSLYLGRAHLTDAYCQVVDDELWLIGADVEPYTHSTYFAHDRRRNRKLLAHRHEIEALRRKVQEKGLTLIPLAVYFKNGKVKVEVGVARGKRQYDKRRQIAEKETRREIERSRKLRE